MMMSDTTKNLYKINENTIASLNSHYSYLYLENINKIIIFVLLNFCLYEMIVKLFFYVVVFNLVAQIMTAITLFLFLYLLKVFLTNYVFQNNLLVSSNHSSRVQKYGVYDVNLLNPLGEV